MSHILRKIHIAHFLQELILFVGFQSLFAVLLFGQIPRLHLFGSSILGHVVYLIVIVIAVWFRHVHARHWLHKLISTTVPLFVHIVLIFFAGFEVLWIHDVTVLSWESIWWIMVMAGSIAGGEYVIHHHGHHWL